MMNDAPGGPEPSYSTDRGHSREYITLRDYTERLLSDQRAYFERVGTDQRSYFERLLSEHEAHHDRDRDANNRALAEARERVEQRLSALNELRAEVTEDRGQLVQRTAFDTRTEAVDKDLKALREDIGSIRQELANQRGRSAAYAVVLGLAVVLVPVLLQFLLRG